MNCFPRAQLKRCPHDLGARRCGDGLALLMVRGCPVLVALRAWRPASRPTLRNSRAIGCRCSMKAEQAGKNAKVLFDCAAPTQFAVRGNRGHGPISHLGFRALSKSVVSWASNARCVGSFDAPGGGRYERVQDRDRAESPPANVAP